MKLKIRATFVLAGALAILVVVNNPWRGNSAFAQQKTEPQNVVTPDEKRTIAAFEARVKDYVKLRNQVKQKIPKLSKRSTANEIEANETVFTEALSAARAGAKPGDLFTADIATYIRAMLKGEFKSTDKKEIRKVVLDSETKIPVPLRVNYKYPEPKEFTEMPPPVLLKLPPLPKEVKYRYVGRNLILLDTDNNLIIDYMLDALP